MRKRKFHIQLQHKSFGVGNVRHCKLTDSGDALLIQFADKTRTILVNSEGWANPDDANGAFLAAPRPIHNRRFG
jgi:hypothetical protein